MLSLAKAHAYGNDFLFIPHDQAEGLDPRALARQTCARQTGVGADGRGAAAGAAFITGSARAVDGT